MMMFPNILCLKFLHMYLVYTWWSINNWRNLFNDSNEIFGLFLVVKVSISLRIIRPAKV